MVGVIVGIGVDVCEVARWKHATARHPGMVSRVLGPDEAGRRPESQAARFAAKEALVKALGRVTGLSWRDVEVVVDDNGAPSFELSRAAARLVQGRGIARIHVSLSHDGGLAVAFVVCEAD